MKFQLRRLWVILIAILTVGLYIPELHTDAEDDMDKNQLGSGSDEVDEQSAAGAFAEVEDSTWQEENEEQDDTDFLMFFTEQAKEQTIHKLGPRISGKIESEIMETIFPALEEVIEDYVSKLPEDQVPYLVIDEQKASYTGEKIFHLHDRQADEDILRFHVRKDLKPKQGYWFNFHYHEQSDGFETHHDIANIYWDKNTPPKWMTH